MDESQRPIFTAVSNSARQLYVLLRCISFSPKALVQITPVGLQFTVEGSRVMQGAAILDKALFASYIYHPPQPSPPNSPSASSDSEAVSTDPVFQISLSAFLETLLIFGVNDSSSNTSGPYLRSTWPSNNASAFTTPALGLNTGICRLTYHSLGGPFNIVLSESNVTTTCSITTYEPEPYVSIAADSVPFARDAVVTKIIMRSSWLHDAFHELASTGPERLTFSTSPTQSPYFALSASGAYGSATVEFPNKDPQLLETFHVNPDLVDEGVDRIKNTYKYDLIKAASKTMAIANKVSIRGDHQGVLSLQFMIDIGNEDGKRDRDRDIGSSAPGTITGKVSFVDFRFVPYAGGDEDDECES